MQSDPIGLEGGENSFVYVGNNPLVRMDESGLYYSYARLRNAYQSREEAFRGRNRSDYDNFYYYDAVWSSNGGSCAYRLSNAFNRAGYSDVIYRAWKYTRYKTLGYKPTGERYMISSYEMALHLGVKKASNEVFSESEVLNKKGIVYFHGSEGGHIDLLETRESSWWFGSDYAYVYGNGVEFADYITKFSHTYFMELND